jgi:hypothetical protein
MLEGFCPFSHDDVRGSVVAIKRKFHSYFENCCHVLRVVLKVSRETGVGGEGILRITGTTARKLDYSTGFAEVHLDGITCAADLERFWCPKNRNLAQPSVLKQTPRTAPRSYSQESP